MSTRSVELATAIFAVLNGDSPPLVGGRIYDHAPDDAIFPHIEVGETQVIPDDTTVDDEGVSENVTIHVWSRYRGMKETKDILSRLHTLLHGQSLTVVGRSSAHAWVRDAQTMRDPDGLTRHGVMQVEVIHRN